MFYNSFLLFLCQCYLIHNISSSSQTSIEKIYFFNTCAKNLQGLSITSVFCTKFFCFSNSRFILLLHTNFIHVFIVFHIDFIHVFAFICIVSTFFFVTMHTLFHVIFIFYDFDNFVKVNFIKVFFIIIVTISVNVNVDIYFFIIFIVIVFIFHFWHMTHLIFVFHFIRVVSAFFNSFFGHNFF